MTAVASLHATPAHNLSNSAGAEPAGGKSVSAAESFSIPRGDLTTVMNFFVPPEEGTVPVEFTTTVKVHDIRGHEDEYNLDKDAFAVIQNVPDSAEKVFRSEESIRKNYYPEVEKLIFENVPGSNRVVFFEVTIRLPIKGNRGAVLKTHIDFTAAFAEELVKRHLGSEAETLLQGRYRIINVWRPLNGPLLSSPLAFISSASVEDSDIFPIDHARPDRTGTTAGVRHNEGQEWHYLSGMRNDERLLLEFFDSDALKEGSQVRGGRVPHSAFVDPRTPVGAPGRESIELRALVFGP